MNIAEQLAGKARRTVKVGGLIWEVRRVRTSDLLRFGRVALQVLAEVADPEAAAKGGKAPKVDPMRLRDSQIDKVQDMLDAQRAMVCAGTVRVRQEGEPWEGIKVTQDPDADPHEHQVYVNDLPDEVVQALADAIQGLAIAPEERAALASFPEEPG